MGGRVCRRARRLTGIEKAGAMSAHTYAWKKMIARMLLSGRVPVAGLGAVAATAHAYNSGPFQWCPGQPLRGLTP